MDDKTWEKYGALGGIWFVVFAVVGSLLAGAPPARDDAAEIAEWFVDNDGAIQTGAFLSGIGVIGLVWWFGTLWRAMRRAGDGGAPRLEVVALTGFVFSGAMAFSGFAVNAATPRASRRSAEAHRSFSAWPASSSRLPPLGPRSWC